MAKAAQHKKYGCVFHRKVSTVIQEPLNILVSVSSAGGMNVKYQHSLRERAVLGDRQRLACWLRSEPLFTPQLQKEMAPSLLRGRTDEKKWKLGLCTISFPETEVIIYDHLLLTWSVEDHNVLIWDALNGMVTWWGIQYTEEKMKGFLRRQSNEKSWGGGLGLLGAQVWDPSKEYMLEW